MHFYICFIAIISTATAFAVPTYTIADEELFNQVNNQRELPPIVAVLDPQPVPPQPSFDEKSNLPDGVNVYDSFADVLELPT